jgi:leucyl-tRNA synthetase
MMELLNHLSDLPDPLPCEAMRTLILLVSPFAQHVAEEPWQKGGYDVERTGTVAHPASEPPRALLRAMSLRTSRISWRMMVAAGGLEPPTRGL